ncbi:MAG: serine/threonine-protein kinase [Gemmataceae bacterium]
MSADRNLLFGILAVQLDFITRDALIAGMGDWLLDKGKPLGDHLRDLGHLSSARLQLLDALVEEHLRQHDNDPQKSLAALSSVEPAVAHSLTALADADVCASLGHVRAGRRDSRSTIDSPAGPASRYEILRPHARGGLGEVFVAEDTELHRSVALKEIQPRHADDPDSRARFLLEAEITGGLEHPGVVPVYGLGTYADGRPFYAMRFVKGDNLQQAIRRFHDLAAGGSPSDEPPATPQVARFDSLEFRQLLRRFVDVCNAVAYAHSRGVLHRDLKPGNVMLGAFGETLVVDWGLAKVVGRAAADGDEPTWRPHSGGSSATVAGRALGTPAYMSPEQASGRLDLLGPTTDVYSLGATLYEVLTGRPPFVGVDLDAVGKGLFPPPRAVHPGVPRALEAVCLKGMALQPGDRYAGALAIAADVDHWLADEPVTAFPEPAGMRLRRWVRRHARLVTGLAATLAVGVVAFALLAWQRELARQGIANEQAATAAERDKVAEERDRAVVARKVTREALDAMVSGVTGESVATQTELSEEQKAFLRRALKYYERFAAEPGEDREGRERLAKAHIQLATIHQRLGQKEEAAAVARRAVELYGGLAADFPTAPGYRSELAGGHHLYALMLKGVGKRAEAEAEYRAALRLRASLAAEFPAVPEYLYELAGSHNNLGVLFWGQGRLPEALAEYRTALALQEKLIADFPDTPKYRFELAGSHHNVGNLLADEGKSADADAALSAAQTQYETLIAAAPTVPDYRRNLARNHNARAILLEELGRHADAVAAYRAAVAGQEKLAANFPAVPEYRSDLARSHHNFGVYLRRMGKRPDAEAAFRAALALRETLVSAFPAVPEYRQELAESHNGLANLLNRSGKPAEAEAAFRAALAVQEKLVGDFPNMPGYRNAAALSRANLGTLLDEMGRRAEAEAELRAALAVQEKLAADQPKLPLFRNNLAMTHNNLGMLLMDLGRRPEAEAALRASVALYDRLVADFPAAPRYRHDLANGHNNLGQLFAAQGNLPAAEAAFRAAFALRERLAADHPDVPSYRGEADSTFFALNDVLVKAGKAAEAVAAVGQVADAPGTSEAQLYDCACIFSLASAVPTDASAAHAARAVQLLRRAVAGGYRNVPHMLKDADLDPLRGRDDYAALLWDLADGLPPSAK